MKIRFSLFFAIFLVIIIVFGMYKTWQFSSQVLTEKARVGGGSSLKLQWQGPINKGDWIAHLVDYEIQFTDGAHNIFPCDIDNDGTIELIANAYRSDALLLYEQKNHMAMVRHVVDSCVGNGYSYTQLSLYEQMKWLFKKHILQGYTSGAHYTAIADLNNNGTEDLIVAGDMMAADIVWYEAKNIGSSNLTWNKHVLYKNHTHRTYHIETGDINGDGLRDIVFTSKTDHSLGWIMNSGKTIPWVQSWIDTSCHRCFYARIEDLDNDGLGEVIATEDDLLNGGILHIFQQSNQSIHSSWIDFPVLQLPPGQGISVFEMVDLDLDGDMDITATSHQGIVYYIENPYPENLEIPWKTVAVHKTLGSDFRELDAGDIDSDGDIDIILADQGLDQIIWLENVDSPINTDWPVHVVDQSHKYLRWCHDVELGDIDGDGDLDVAVAAAASNVFFWYENNI